MKDILYNKLIYSALKKNGISGFRTLVILIMPLLFCNISTSDAQTGTFDFLNIRGTTGRGLRFWSSDSYKIHMGNSSEYRYGPVTDYSIKMNMNNDSRRGWTWGVVGLTPVAALNTQGNLKLKGYLEAASLRLDGKILTNYFVLDNNGTWFRNDLLIDDQEIFTAGPTDRNWRIGQSQTPGFARSLINGSTQYITYYGSDNNQGISFGSNNGDSGFEMRGSDHQAYFRGKVGLGTTALTERFHVNGRMKIDGSSAGLWIDSGTSDWFIGRSSGAGSSLRFYNGGDRLTIKSNGSVGIGRTPDDKYKLDVNGYLRVTKGARFDCVGCGSSTNEFGTANWGNLTIQGRVLSTNDNLHLSPPGNRKVIINDTYRGAGGTSTGNAGLEVSGETFLAVDGGNVGIGNKNPSQKLDVSGNIKASSFIGDGSQLTNLPPVSQLRTGNTVLYVETPAARTYRTGVTNTATGLSLRISQNPPSGSPILQVRSSGQATRFYVEHDGYTGGENSAYFTGSSSRPHIFGYKTVIGSTNPNDLISGSQLTVRGRADFTNDIRLSGKLLDNNGKDLFEEQFNRIVDEVDDPDGSALGAALIGGLAGALSGAVAGAAASLYSGLAADFGEAAIEALGEVAEDAADEAFNNAKNSRTVTPWKKAVSTYGSGIKFTKGTVYIGNAPSEAVFPSTSRKLLVTGRAEINGDLTAKRIAVAPSPTSFNSWPDYVFAPDYELKSLEEVEAYIQENRHLPEVPSASTIAQEGLDLGNMDATLLKKVEELTLYIIEQNKQLEAQSQQLQEMDILKKRMEALEALLTERSK